MNSYSIKDIAASSDRHKIYTLKSNSIDLPGRIASLQSENIAALNIGKELAAFISKLDNHKYLNIDAYDFIKKLLEEHKSKLNGTGNNIAAIYNLGILLEPKLEFNAVQLLKEFSKSASIIIIWEYQSDIPDRLTWPTQKQKFFLDFSDIHLKEMHYAI
jgi:hypothetical protein